MKNLRNVIKMFRIFNISVFLLLFSSCVVSPWEKDLYINPETDNVTTIDNIPSPIKYRNYYINGAFINTRVLSKDRGAYHGRAPYVLILGVSGDFDQHKSITINKFEIISSLDKNYYMKEVKEVPLKFSFKPISYTNQKTQINMARLTYTFEDDFNFDFENKEELYINLMITVTCIDKEETGWVKFHFIPKKRKGILKFISI